MKTRRLEIFAFTAILLAAAALFVSLQGSVRAAPGRQEAGPAVADAPQAVSEAPQVALAPQATIPSTFNYQGFLRNPDGSLVSGSRNITLKIYNQAASGTPLHQETFAGVPVRDGLFNVVLGDGTALPANLFTNNAPLFIGVVVNTDPELIPRQRVHPVPWALQATTLVPNANVQGLNLKGETLIGAMRIWEDGNGVLTFYGGATKGFQLGFGPVWRFGVDEQHMWATGNADIAGNTSIGGTATVKGKSVVVGEESNLRIVKGAATANTTVGTTNPPIWGAGFTYKKISQGVVDVTFDTPFSGRPVVTANPISAGAIFIGLEGLGGGGNPGSNGFRAVMYDTGNNGRDWPFNFIAIGTRSDAASAAAEGLSAPADALPADGQ